MSIDNPILSDPPSDDELAKRLEIAVDELNRDQYPNLDSDIPD